jgi:hypothetical protein
MTNRVGGRFAQEAAFYISVGGVLIEKSITLEGQAAPDPNPPPAADGPAEDATDIDVGEQSGSSSVTADQGE